MDNSQDNQPNADGGKRMSEAEIDELMQAIYDDIAAENDMWRRGMLIEIIGGKKD